MLGVAAAGLATACASRGPSLVVRTWPSDPAADELCAWYGDRDGDTLYFGESAFWSAMRGAGGDPSADLAVPGPRRIGRLDLAHERLLDPLAASVGEEPTGVWDVLAHPDGRIWFTTYFDLAGAVDPGSGRVERFEQAGLGLNELALGEEGRVLVTRYGAGERGPGSLVVLRPDGTIEAEHLLSSGGAGQIAPKTPAWDPLRREVWITSDRLPESAAPATPRGARRPTIVLGEDGRERRRYEEDEIQFVRFDELGRGFLARVDGRERRLWLTPVPSEALADLSRAPGLLLDDDFPAELDFVQEIRVETGGRVVVTRWSGRIHVALLDGAGGLIGARTLELPQLERGGLYYTAVSDGERVCATYCGGVRVVCADDPWPARGEPALLD